MTLLSQRQIQVTPEGPKFRQTIRAVLIRGQWRLTAWSAFFLFGVAMIYLLSLNIVTRTSSQTFENSQYLLYFRLLVFAIPFFVGVLGGAPLMATDYESEVYRFAYTQGVGRRRLFLATIMAYSALIVMGMAIVGVGIHHFYFIDWQVRARAPWSFAVFFSQPQLILAITFCCFCVGTFLGAIIRRTLSSIAATIFAVSAGSLIIFVELYHRSLSLFSVMVATNDPEFLHRATLRTIGAKSWTEFNSQFLLLDTWFSNGRGLRVNAYLSPSQFRALRANHHYTFWIRFVPPSHYHTLQFLWIFSLLGVGVIAIMGAFHALGGNDRLLKSKHVSLERANAFDIRVDGRGGGDNQAPTSRTLEQ
jgi:hypothetical protein